MSDSPAQKEGSTPPRVFLSYTHESEEHTARVLALANRLRQNGVDARLDQYEVDPSEGWPLWSEEQIREADFVLLVCTETYNQRVMGEENSETGRGIRWEGKLIYQYIYDGETPRKFIPVLFEGSKPEDIPAPLRRLTYYDVSTDVGYEALYRRLLNQPNAVIPSIGQRRDLPPSARATAGPASTTSTPPAHLADELTIDDLSNFVLSVENKKILHRARILGTFGNDNPPIVSTSCLLVGIAEGGRNQPDPFMTPQFLWREIQRADEQSYRKFLSERFPHIKYSSSDETIAFDGPEQAGVITSNVLNVFRHAQEISKATVKKPPVLPNAPPKLENPDISARHVLAALLTVEHTGAIDRLARIFDVSLLRSKFLTFIVESVPDDNADAWRKILASEEAPAESEGDGAVEGATSVSQVDKGFAARLPGFQADYWVGEDLLDITADVNSLASLVAACSVDPPLSIGLFGDWGSGKTHFMKQMRARVDKLSQKARDSAEPQNKMAYYRNIVQIEFNAWHYVEGNLWASLVEHIFDNLRIPEKKGRKDGKAQVEDARLAVMEQLGLKKELQAKVEKRQEELKAKEQDAMGRAEEAKTKRDDTSQDLVNLRDNPEPSVINELATVTFSADQRALLEALGIPSGTLYLPGEIHKRYQDAQSLGSKIRAQWNLFRADAEVLKKSVWILGVLVLTVLAGLIARKYFAGAITYIASAVTFILTFGAAAKPYYEKFKKGMSTLKEKYDQIEQERQKEIVKLQNDVSVLSKEYKEAENEAKAINKEVADLQAQLEDTTAGKLLAGFIEDRAACSDYRRHLGVLALIRRDFEKLSDLLSEQRKSEATKADGAINRIILYIDDLDRCPPERVVQVLQAIHLLLAFPLFVVVVGVDARWVTRSLQESYEWLQSEEDEAQETSDGKRESAETSLATPHDYLEKIFQIPFWLKPMEDSDCKKLLEGLTRDSRTLSQPSQNGSAGQNARGESIPETPTEPKSPDAENALMQVAKMASAGVTVPEVHTRTTSAVTSKQNVVDETNSMEIAESARSGAHSIEVQTGIDGKQAVANPSLEPESEGETDHDQIDLAPNSLTLADKEIEYMKELTPLIGRSPRAVKRFLNCYRLIKVGLRPAELEAFLGPDGKRGEFTTAMVLLGVITGSPSISFYFIEELEKCSRSMKDKDLGDLLISLEKNPEVIRQPDWIRVRDFLERNVGFRNSKKTLAGLIRIAPRVSRYSFRVARVEAAQRRKTAVASRRAVANGPATQTTSVNNPD